MDEEGLIEEIVEDLCDEAAWIEAGVVAAIGRPDRIIALYRRSCAAEVVVPAPE